MQTAKSNQGNSHAGNKNGMKNDQKANDKSKSNSKSSGQNLNDENDEYENDDLSMENEDYGQKEIETNPTKREHTVKADNKNTKTGQSNSANKKHTSTH